jgi:hypothetical protein
VRAWRQPRQVHPPQPAPLQLTTSPTWRAAAKQLTTFTIPSPQAPRRPANIPLRTLSSQPSRSNSHSAALLGGSSDEKQGRRSSLSQSDSPDSDFSWSDTGDLAEQLAEDDPLQIRLRASLDEQVFGGSSRRPQRQKRVRYLDEFENAGRKEHQAGIAKEEIEIPEPAPRYITRAEHIIASIMSGGERQMNGLTGKPLV